MVYSRQATVAEDEAINRQTQIVSEGGRELTNMEMYVKGIFKYVLALFR